MDEYAMRDVTTAGELDPAAGAARELLHRSGALAVRIAVDRGAAGAAVVACERFSAIEVVDGQQALRLPHDTEVAAPSGMPEVPFVPPLAVDPEEGSVAAPLGLLGRLADALAAVAGLLGGRSVAAVVLETDREDEPLGLTARPGEAPVLTLAGRQFHLPG